MAIAATPPPIMMVFGADMSSSWPMNKQRCDQAEEKLERERSCKGDMKNTSISATSYTMRRLYAGLSGPREHIDAVARLSDEGVDSGARYWGDFPAAQSIVRPAHPTEFKSRAKPSSATTGVQAHPRGAQLTSNTTKNKRQSGRVLDNSDGPCQLDVR